MSNKKQKDLILITREHVKTQMSTEILAGASDTDPPKVKHL